MGVTDFFGNIFKNKDQITQEASDLQTNGLDELKSGDFTGLLTKAKTIFAQVTGSDDDDDDESSDDSDDSDDDS